jgi:hypothetical protein
MRFVYGLTALMLLGAALFFPACKGETGPAGPAGDPVTVYYTPATPTPVCSSPSSQGLTTAGSIFGDSGTWIYACAVTLSGDSTAVSISVNVLSGPVSGQVRMGIYSDISNAPYLLVTQTGPQNIVSGWNRAAISGVYLPAGTYWLAFLFSNFTNATYNSGTGSEYSVFYGWGELPATYPGGASTGAYRDSIYISTCP